ncbi:hypothetical protein [Embleya sp. MST-111070]|uniref:hypothetical protein n=1 Tax=Embleya sp. MST-111070 TaxID=3398231 RepID=UPI003F73D697
MVRVVVGAAEPVPAKDVCAALGTGVLPGKVEAMRGKLKRLAARGWLHQTPAGRFAAR